MQLYEWRERRWLSPSLCERHRSPLTLGGCSELKSVCPKSNQKFQAWGFSLTGSSHLHLSNYFWVPNHSHYYFFYTQAVMILVLNTEPSIHFHCMFLLPAFSQKHSTRYLLSSQFFGVFLESLLLVILGRAATQQWFTDVAWGCCSFHANCLTFTT